MMINQIEEQRIFDRAGLMSRLMGDEELALEVLAAFLNDMHDQIPKLKKAVATGNDADARYRAHTVKGASANMGAVGLQQAAFETENMVIKQGVSAAADLVPKVEEQLAQLEALLAREGVVAAH